MSPTRLLILAGCLLLLSESYAQVQQVQRCGNSNSCIAGRSECINGQCACLSPYIWGDPQFNCYESTTLAAELKNDPSLVTFQKEVVAFAYPCRYLVTHVVQELKDYNHHVTGSCEFIVYAYNAKERGKMYTHGFDVATRITYINGDTVSMSARTYGIAKKHIYKFKSMGTMGQFLPEGPWESDDINYVDNVREVNVAHYEDARNNHMVFEVVNCGFRLTFVPYDIIKKQKQISVPGLSIALDRTNNPVFYSQEKTMALSPDSNGDGLIQSHLFYRLKGVNSMLARGFSTGLTIRQNQPMNDKGQCLAASSALGRCSTLYHARAMKNCVWMLKQPRFIHCYDKSRSAKKILKLFSMCVDYWCKNGPCGKVKRKIVKAGCHQVRDIDELTNFMVKCKKR